MLNFHAWIVDENNNIIDWDFNSYETTKDLLNLTDEKCYEPFNSKKQIEYACYVKTQIDKKKIIEGFSYDAWLDEFYYKPKSLLCQYNALAYKKHNPKCKIVFGKFGWLKKNGEPFWEFGGSEIDSKKNMNDYNNALTMKMNRLNRKQQLKYMKKFYDFSN